MTVNILGTDYKIIVDSSENPEMKDRSGYCYPDAQEIHIQDLNDDKEWKNEPLEVRNRRTNIILRHEITHAFLIESGLHQNSTEVNAWALNEEMVDWIAFQFPKMLKVFKDVGCI